MEESDAKDSRNLPMRPPMEHISLVEERLLLASRRSQRRTPTLRDLTAIIFRHRLLLISSFLAILLVAVLATWMPPNKYVSSMKILVKRERADAVMTPQPNSQPYIVPDVTPEVLNSEVELIKSRDLLEKVVVSCGLHKAETPSSSDSLLEPQAHADRKPAGEDMRIPRAVRALQGSLTVEPIAKSNLIGVTYEAQDPELAAKVLETLSNLYLEKHLTVHRPSGALDFFQQQTDEYQKGLAAAEQNLARFGQNEGVVSVEIEKDITLRKLNDFESQLRETQAAEAAVARRIKSLEAQAYAIPQRVTTQIRTSDNASLLQKLRSTLLDLELKRTELLTKYEPSYPLVQQVDVQISQARDALAQAENNSLRDEVTELDKTRARLDEELALARAELANLQGRSAVITQSLEDYREKAKQIGRREIEHMDLVRAAKIAEENYLLYLRKQEEARISEALDRKRIVNVAIAEAPTVPSEPSGPKRGLTLLLGLFVACSVSLALPLTVDYLNPSFRTPDEVQDYLGIPVIGSLPYRKPSRHTRKLIAGITSRRSISLRTLITVMFRVGSTLFSPARSPYPSAGQRSPTTNAVPHTKVNASSAIESQSRSHIGEVAGSPKQPEKSEVTDTREGAETPRPPDAQSASKQTRPVSDMDPVRSLAVIKGPKETLRFICRKHVGRELDDQLKHEILALNPHLKHLNRIRSGTRIQLPLPSTATLAGKVQSPE